MSELHDSVDYNNLKFEYVGPKEDVGFYGYSDSKEFFNAIKNNQIKFSELKNKQNEFLNRLSNIKIGRKTTEQKEAINCSRDYIEMLPNMMPNMMRDKIKQKEQDLKY